MISHVLQLVHMSSFIGKLLIIVCISIPALQNLSGSNAVDESTIKCGICKLDFQTEQRRSNEGKVKKFRKGNVNDILNTY